MIEQMNACTNLKEDQSVCGGLDFSLSHRVEGNSEEMIVTLRCNGCKKETEYPVNMFNAVKAHIETCKCGKKVNDIVCNTLLTVVGTTGIVQGDKLGEPVMKIPTQCPVCNNTMDYNKKIRDVVNPFIIAPHNIQNT